MFALGIVDKLTPGSLTGGRFIAGTGTIDDDGQGRPDRRHHAEDDRRPGQRRDGLPRPRPTTAPRPRRRAGRAAAGQGRTLSDDAVASLDDAAGRPAPPTCRAAEPPGALSPSSVAASASASPGTRSRPVSTEVSLVVGPQPQRAPSATRPAAPPRRSGPPAAPGARPASCSASCLVLRHVLLDGRRQHQPLDGQRRAEHLGRPGDAGEQLVEAARASGRSSCSTGVRPPGSAGAEAELGGQLGSRRSRSAVSTRANRCGGWSQPGGRGVPLDVEGQPVEPAVAARAPVGGSVMPRSSRGRPDAGNYPPCR